MRKHHILAYEKSNTYVIFLWIEASVEMLTLLASMSTHYGTAVKPDGSNTYSIKWTEITEDYVVDSGQSGQTYFYMSKENSDILITEILLQGHIIFYHGRCQVTDKQMVAKKIAL